MGKGKTRSLRSVLTDVASSIGLDDPVEKELHVRWAEAVGSDLALLCGPEKLAGGRLTVAVGSAVVKYEMTMRRERLREKLNAWLGKEHIKEVHVKLRRKYGS
jgi:hypothetical protein